MKKFSKKQWIKFSIAAVLYLLFTLWMQNAWLLLGLIVLVDIFLTGYIPWGAWKRTKNPQVRNVLEWVDDILFALVAVYFINIFIFQNYQIPSSSLEKSLLVGDYLFVSKLSYGPRVPNTPVAFPLVQNTLPFFNCKSYLDWPEWDYKRVKGLGHVKRNDIVVFNFPAGDTVALKVQNPDYYHLVEQYGRDGRDGPLHPVVHGVLAPGLHEGAVGAVHPADLGPVQPGKHLRVVGDEVQHAHAALGLSVVQIAAQLPALVVGQGLFAAQLHAGAGHSVIAPVHLHIPGTGFVGTAHAQPRQRRALQRAVDDEGLSGLRVHQIGRAHV